jgi:hypothetical protein
MPTDILLLVLIVAVVWDLGRRFAARGQSVKREELLALDEHAKDLSLVQAGHSDNLLTLNRAREIQSEELTKLVAWYNLVAPRLEKDREVLANHAQHLTKIQGALTSMGLDKAFAARKRGA